MRFTGLAPHLDERRDGVEAAQRGPRRAHDGEVLLRAEAKLDDVARRHQRAEQLVEQPQRARRTAVALRTLFTL